MCIIPSGPGCYKPHLSYPILTSLTCSIICVNNKAALQRANVTHILSVLRLKPSEETFAAYQHHSIDVDDVDDENLLEHFPAAVRFIQSGLDAGGSVLVHWSVYTALLSTAKTPSPLTFVLPVPLLCRVSLQNHHLVLPRTSSRAVSIAICTWLLSSVSRNCLYWMSLLFFDTSGNAEADVAI